MKPKNDIPKLIKKMQMKASAELDRRVYNDISRATVAGPTIWKVITRGGAMKLAVAASIIVAFGLGFLIGQQSEKSQPAASLAAVPSHPTAPKTEDSFWQQKIIAAMQPRPYAGSEFDKASLIDTYKQYLKEKHYD